MKTTTVRTLHSEAIRYVDSEKKIQTITVVFENDPNNPSKIIVKQGKKYRQALKQENLDLNQSIFDTAKPVKIEMVRFIEIGYATLNSDNTAETKFVDSCHEFIPGVIPLANGSVRQEVTLAELIEEILNDPLFEQSLPYEKASEHIKALPEGNNKQLPEANMSEVEEETEATAKQ